MCKYTKLPIANVALGPEAKDDYDPKETGSPAFVVQFNSVQFRSD